MKKKKLPLKCRERMRRAYKWKASCLLNVCKDPNGCIWMQFRAVLESAALTQQDHIFVFIYISSSSLTPTATTLCLICILHIKTLDACEADSPTHDLIFFAPGIIQPGYLGIIKRSQSVRWVFGQQRLLLPMAATVTT